MKLVKVIFILFMINQAFAAKLNVKSNPSDCDVFVVNKNGQKNGIGKTPYETDIDTLISNYGQDGPIQLEVFKPGFEKYSITVPLVKNSDIDITANLEVEKDVKLAQDFDLLVTDLFDVLRMMRVKDFDTAFKKLQVLEVKFPHFSIIHEMKGSIAYMKKEFKQSLNFYRKAFGLNPKNREAYRMKVYLEKKFGLSNGAN